MTAPTLAPTTYVSPRGTWSIAAKHTRHDGAVDVVLAFRPNTPALNRRLYAYRYTPGDGWRQVLIVHAHTVPAAVRTAAEVAETWPVAYEALLPLLDATADLPDFPATSAAERSAL